MARTLPVAAFVVVMVLFAGCTAPPAEPQPRALYQVTTEIGEGLYAWDDPAFTEGFGDTSDRRVRAELVVPDNIQAVGFTFRGHHRTPEESRASFTVRDGNTTLLHWNATPGQEDDTGVISTFWQFSDALALTPGSYQMIAAGDGDIGLLSFEAHGIPYEPVPFAHTFEVAKVDRPVLVDLFIDGWGRAPNITVEGPGGVREDRTLAGPSENLAFEVAAHRGTYGVTVDTTEWAGTVVLRARQ